MYFQFLKGGKVVRFTFSSKSRQLRCAVWTAKVGTHTRDHTLADGLSRLNTTADEPNTEQSSKCTQVSTE